MKLVDMLGSHQIDPKKVIVLRHRPPERLLRAAIRTIAADEPDLFNTFQRTQSEKLEAAMVKAKYVASFVASGPGKALFIGLYSINGARPITREQYWQIPEHVTLRDKYGVEGFTKDTCRETILWFDLELNSQFYSGWKGKLVITWPPPEISWWRRAHNKKNDFSVVCVHEEQRLVPRPPDWRTLDLSWSGIAKLPSSWRIAFQQWRGIYYIFDEETRMGYVGSAYGEDNILGRWENYASTGHGGNVLLKRGKPERFRFSILQVVDQDMKPSDVIKLETTWKIRLRTRTPNGLNDN